MVELDDVDRTGIDAQAAAFAEALVHHYSSHVAPFSSRRTGRLAWASRAHPPDVYKRQGYGYIEVTSDASHTLGAIITNDLVEDSTYQTVSEGQYVKLSEVTATLA